MCVLNDVYISGRPWPTAISKNLNDLDYDGMNDYILHLAKNDNVIPSL